VLIPPVACRFCCSPTHSRSRFGPPSSGLATVLKAAEMAVAIDRITGIAAVRSGQHRLASGGAIADFLVPRI
jgi:hypothetical protein